MKRMKEELEHARSSFEVLDWILSFLESSGNVTARDIVREFSQLDRKHKKMIEQHASTVKKFKK